MSPSEKIAMFRQNHWKGSAVSVKRRLDQLYKLVDEDHPLSGSQSWCDSTEVGYRYTALVPCDPDNESFRNAFARAKECAACFDTYLKQAGISTVRYPMAHVADVDNGRYLKVEVYV